MRHLLMLITILSFVTIGCDKAPTIPSDVSYSIIDSHTLPGIKRSLFVRLNKKVSKETLRAIALKLKSQDSRNYTRTFVTFDLPSDSFNHWARARFDPKLEVEIMGLTIEEEQKLVAEPTPANREIIGRWLQDGIAGHLITIFREGGRLFIEQKYEAGSDGHKGELVEKRSQLGRRFDPVEETYQAHWILDSNGNLQVHDDNHGHFNTANKIERGGG